MPAWDRGVLLQVVLFGWVDCWNKTLSGYVRLVDCRCGGVLGMGRQSSVAPTDVTTVLGISTTWVISGLPLASGRLRLDWVPTAKWSAIHEVVWTVQQSLG